MAERNPGVSATAGFNYQHIYAATRILELLHERRLISAIFEGVEDLELFYRQRNQIIRERVQVKSREEGQSPWTFADIVARVILPMIERKTADGDTSIVRFVTEGDGNADVIALREALHTARSKDGWTETDLQNFAKKLDRTARRKSVRSLEPGDLRSLLDKLEINTRNPGMPLLIERTHVRLRELGVEPVRIPDKCDRLFSKIAMLSGTKAKDDTARSLTARSVAAILEIPFEEAASALGNIHAFKDPAEAWYVHRKEEVKIEEFLQSIAQGTPCNLLITGASGIGKSSLLNNVRTMAASPQVLDRVILTVKMRVFETDFNDFLLQLYDEMLEQLASAGMRLPAQQPASARNRLIGLLKPFRQANQTPILVLIDQFERLFEESKVRIDTALMRDVWRRFTEIARELQQLGRISFIITAREHYFWIIFPTDTELRESRFSYLMLHSLDSQESSTLLHRLLEISGHCMSQQAENLFLANSENEPQIIVLAFIAAFDGWLEERQMEVDYLAERAPWNEVFKREIDAICRDELTRLVVFATASIERELCDGVEILERVKLVMNCSPQEVKDTLHRLQNERHLLKQPREGKFSFYHRKIGEYILTHRRSEFPAEWADDGLIWDVNKMILEETRTHGRLNTLIGIEKARIIDNFRDRVTLNDETLALVAKSCFAVDLNTGYWLDRALELPQTFTEGFCILLAHEAPTARTNAVHFLIKRGDISSAPAISNILSLDLHIAPKDIVKAMEPFKDLAEAGLSAMRVFGYVPTEMDILQRWVFTALYLSHESDYWMRVGVTVLSDALSPFFQEMKISDRDRTPETLFTKSNVADVLLGCRLAQRRDLLSILMDRSERHNHFYDERYNNSKSICENIIKGCFVSLQVDLDLWLSALREYVEMGDAEQATLILRLLNHASPTLGKKPVREILRTTKQLEKQISASMVPDTRPTVLRQVIKLRGKLGDETGKRSAQRQLVRLLDLSPATVAEMLHLYCELGQVNPVMEVLAACPWGSKPESEHVEEISNILSALETVAETFPRNDVAINVIKVFLAIAAWGNSDQGFSDLLHARLIACQDALLGHVAGVIGDKARRYLAGLHILRCSTARRADLTISAINRMVALGKLPFVRWINKAIREFEAVRQDLMEQLSWKDEELKGAILERLAHVHDLVGSRDALALKAEAINAYRTAAHKIEDYEDEASYNMHFRLLSHCYVLSVELVPDSNHANLLDRLSWWEMDELLDDLHAKGYLRQMNYCLDRYLDECNDVDYSIGGLPRFIEKHNWQAAYKCINWLMERDWFWHYDNMLKAIRIFIPVLRNDDSNPDLEKLKNVFLESDVSWLLANVADVLREEGETELARRVTILAFRENEDDEELFDRARNAMIVASELSDWSLALECWTAIQKTDKFWIDPEECVDIALTILRCTEEDPVLSELRTELLDNEHTEFLALLRSALQVSGIAD